MRTRMPIPGIPYVAAKQRDENCVRFDLAVVSRTDDRREDLLRFGVA